MPEHTHPDPPRESGLHRLISPPFDGEAVYLGLALDTPRREWPEGFEPVPDEIAVQFMIGMAVVHPSRGANMQKLIAGVLAGTLTTARSPEGRMACQRTYKGVRQLN